MSNLSVVATLSKHTLLNVSAVLRAIADEMDKGRYGEVGCAVLVVLGDELTVHSAGPDSAGPSAYLTLVGGMRQLEQMLLDHGK